MKKLTRVALAAASFVLAGAATAALFDVRAFYDLQVKLSQPAFADGSVKLAPGTYDVHFTTSADGSVRAGFFQRGVKIGEAHGIIAVRKAGGERAHTFQSLGFGPSSPTALRSEGRKLFLDVGAPGTNQITIGLLLPAVQPK